jgi:hypothetical protein
VSWAGVQDNENEEDDVGNDDGESVLGNSSVGWGTLWLKSLVPEEEKASTTCPELTGTFLSCVCGCTEMLALSGDLDFFKIFACFDVSSKCPAFSLPSIDGGDRLTFPEAVTVSNSDVSSTGALVASLFACVGVAKAPVKGGADAPGNEKAVSVSDGRTVSAEGSDVSDPSLGL